MAKEDDSMAKEDEKRLTDIPGIGPGIAAKLEAAGVYDLMGLAVMSPAALSEMAGIGEAVARKAIQAARGMMNLGFMDGSEFAKKREDVGYITTGSKNLNELLGGKGVETRAVTEAYGAFGSGKTQLGLCLAVNVQMPKEQGGAGGKAVFIDTEGTFRPERIMQIAEGIGADPEKVLKNILVARAFNSDHQILLIDRIGELIKEGEPIRIVIIDSLTAHFRAEFSGRGQLADRQQKLNRYLHNLMKMAEQHNLAVYVTNQVMANPAMMFGDPTTAVGGNIVGHACLIGDSLIQLADGSLAKMEQIGQKKVMSSEFSKMKLEKADSEQVFVNPNVKEVYTIKTNNWIECSWLHRFFTIDNFEVMEKEANELKVGDFIAQADKVNIEGEDREIPRFKVKRIGVLPRGSAEEVKEKLFSRGISRRAICSKIGITPRQLRRVLNQESPTSFEALEKIQSHMGQDLILQLNPAFSYKHKNLIMPEFLTPSLGQIFGYFLGDGNVEEGGLRFRDAREEVLQVYNYLFKQVFGRGGHIFKMSNKNCFTLYINSREIAELFRVMKRNVLEEVGKSKAEVVNSFVKGFVDAEGHINKKRAHITVVQKDKEWLRHIQMFLLRSGIRSTIKFNIGKKKMNILRIADRDTISYLQIGFSAPDKQERLIECAQKCKKSYSYEIMPVKRKEIAELMIACRLKPFLFIKSRPESYQWISRRELKNAFNAMMNCTISDRQVKQKIEFIGKLLSGEINFARIREICIKENKEIMYDFAVPSHENYLANGFIVHNSTYRMYLRRGKQGSRVAKLIDSPNLPDNECQFYVTKAGVKDEGEEE